MTGNTLLSMIMERPIRLEFNESLQFLAPYFDIQISEVKNPVLTLLDTTPGFIPPNEVILPQTVHNKEAISHEAGHFLHYNVNPGAFESEDPSSRIGSEIVAYNSSFVYTFMNPEDVNISQERISKADDVHRDSYLIAFNLFRKYKGEKISELARHDISNVLCEAKRLLE